MNASVIVAICATIIAVGYDQFFLSIDPFDGPSMQNSRICSDTGSAWRFITNPFTAARAIGRSGSRTRHLSSDTHVPSSSWRPGRAWKRSPNCAAG